MGMELQAVRVDQVNIAGPEEMIYPVVMVIKVDQVDQEKMTNPVNKVVKVDQVGIVGPEEMIIPVKTVV